MAGELKTVQVEDNLLAASAAGRAKMATSFFDVATALDKWPADAIANAWLIQAIANGAYQADAGTLALFADEIWTAAKLAAGSVTPPKVGLVAWNATGAALTVGQLVYVSGYSAANALPTLTLADADAGGRRAAWVVTAEIANGASGTVGKRYRWTAQNTGGSAEGNPTYLDTTAGAWTLTAPTGASIQQIVGQVEVVDGATGVVVLDLAANAGLEKIGNAELQDGAVTAIKIGAQAVGSSQLDYNTQKVATGTLSSAQLLALRATPITAVAGIAGFVTVFHRAVFFYDYGSVAYTITAGGDDLVVRYTDGAGAIVSQTLDTAGILDQAADVIKVLGPIDADLVGVSGADLVFDNIGANEWTVGDSPVRYAVHYSIHSTGF